MRRRLPTAAAALVLVGWTVACSSSDGRTLPPPDPGQTTTSVSTPVVGQPSEGASAVFALTSPAFAGGGAMPVAHTCDGEDVSPPLEWTASPPAEELALVARDLDAGGFVHWVVAGIDPLVLGVGAGGVPEGAVEAANDGGSVGWTGPCPPPGTTHTYELVLHALPQPLSLAPGTPGPEAAAIVEGASSAQASLTATYGR